MNFKSKHEGPWEEVAYSPGMKTGDWRFQRPVTRVRKCRQCGLCYLQCPSGCVSDRGSYYSAGLDYCKGCGICARVCPVSAIAMVREAA